MPEPLYGLTADQVARIRRVLHQVEAHYPRTAGRGTPQTVSRTKLGKNTYSTVAAGGYGLFDWMQSTASGTTETLVAASTIQAYDWFGTGCSTGEKVLLFRPEPSPRWYFVKPNTGTPTYARWGKVSVACSTAVASGFGSTFTNWCGINPCDDAGGVNGLDTATTYVIELPDIIKGASPYLTTGDVVAYSTCSNSANVCVSQYAALAGMFRGEGSRSAVATNADLITGLTAYLTSCSVQKHVTVNNLGTTTFSITPHFPGYWQLNATVTINLAYSTTDHNVKMQMMIDDDNIASPYLDTIRVYKEPDAWRTLSYSCVVRATTSDTWTPIVYFDTTSVGAQLDIATVAFSGHLIHPTVQDYTSGI